MPSNRKKAEAEYQTFSRLDLEAAINYECYQWGELRRRFPFNKQLEPPFDVRTAYWPDIERSQEMRAKAEEKLMKNSPPSPQYNAGEPIKIKPNINIPQPPQNASQYHSSKTSDNDSPFDTPEYFKKYQRGLLDAERRRQSDIEEIQKEYNNVLKDMIKSKALLGSNLDSSPTSSIAESVWSDSEDSYEKPKNDFKQKSDLSTETDNESHWIWRYCIPYVTVSGILAAVAHFIALR